MQSFCTWSTSVSFCNLMPSYSLEEPCRWCPLFSQPHVLSAKLTRCCYSNRLHEVWPDTHHLASTATPISAFCPGVHSPSWHAQNWKCKGVTPHVATLDSGGSWGMKELADRGFPPHPSETEFRTALWMFLRRSQRDLSPSCPPQWIAWQYILAWPFLLPSSPSLVLYSFSVGSLLRRNSYMQVFEWGSDFQGIVEMGVGRHEIGGVEMRGFQTKKWVVRSLPPHVCRSPLCADLRQVVTAGALTRPAEGMCCFQSDLPTLLHPRHLEKYLT